jgi:hypothetical protein
MGLEMAEIIDIDLPFTEVEVCRALRLMMPPGEARTLAREIAQLPAQTAALAEQAEVARQGGSTDPHEINAPQWYVSDEIFALLSCVSDAIAARVDRFMEQRWEREFQSCVQGELLRRRIWSDVDPPSDVLALARRRVGYQKAAWTRRRRRIERDLRRLRA